MQVTRPATEWILWYRYELTKGGKPYCERDCGDGSNAPSAYFETKCGGFGDQGIRPGRRTQASARCWL